MSILVLSTESLGLFFTMEEIWKPVQGFEKAYFISNLGRIKNSQGNIVQTFINGRGYEVGVLFQGKRKAMIRVHRLVAIAFIPNPNNFPIVNHRDEDCTNNTASNLEWCTTRYNLNYGTSRARLSEAVKGENNHNYGKHLSEECKKKLSLSLSGRRMSESHKNKIGRSLWKKVEMRNPVTMEKHTFSSLKEASAYTGLSCGLICSYCRGYKKPRNGFIWKYGK